MTSFSFPSSCEVGYRCRGGGRCFTCESPVGCVQPQTMCQLHVKLFKRIVQWIEEKRQVKYISQTDSSYMQTTQRQKNYQLMILVYYSSWMHWLQVHWLPHTFTRTSDVHTNSYKTNKNCLRHRRKPVSWLCRYTSDDVICQA